MKINYETTWIGLIGGGVSGSLVAGGSVFQIDVFNMGGKKMPARVLVTGKRVGIMAEANCCSAMLLITGCNDAAEMEGMTSSGIDWEVSGGLKAGQAAKMSAIALKELTMQAVSGVANWAKHEGAKRVVQWMTNDLGVVKPGKQFNLLPTPLGVGVGLGVFYEWQKLNLLSGDLGWSYFSPQWYLQKYDNGLRLQMHGIPEQNGAEVDIGIAIDEFGLDPYIRWKRKATANGVRIDTSSGYKIVGRCHDGSLFAPGQNRGYSGIQLSDLQPIGMIEENLFSIDNTKTVKKNDTAKIYPVCFRATNMTHWSGSNSSVKVKLDSDGRLSELAGH